MLERLGEVLDQLEAVRRLAKQGLDQSDALLARTGRGGSWAAGPLRRLQKTERRLRAAIDAQPALVFLMQTEIQDLAADTRARGRGDRTLLERTGRLCAAAARAADALVEHCVTLESIVRDTLRDASGEESA